MKNLRWKFILTAAVAALAVWSVTPPSERIRLGLDLKGGVHLVLQVQTDDALKLETDTSAEQLHQALKDAGVAVTGARPTSLTEFVVEGVPPASDAQFRQTAQLVAQSFDRDAEVGGRYTFRMVVAPYGTAGDQIVVQLPGLTDVPRAKRIIRNTAILEIKLVEGGPASDEKTLLAAHQGTLPDDLEIVPGLSGTRGDPTRYLYLVRKVAAITGRDLKNARQSPATTSDASSRSSWTGSCSRRP
jgi:preprotein translocase subunit SecD